MNRKNQNMSTEDPVIQVVESNKENIDILNTFSKEFFSTNNVINEKINNILAKIDALTVEEKQKENLLNILESKITPIELGNTLKQLVEQRVMLNDKYNDLNNTIINNNKKIEMISNTIKDNKQIVDSVYKIIGVLDDNINSINNTLNTRNI